MTKAELIKALENLNDNDEIVTFTYGQDRDGWPTKNVVIIKEVTSKETNDRKNRSNRIEELEEDIVKYEKMIARKEMEIKEEKRISKAAEMRNEARNHSIELYKGWIAKAEKEIAELKK